MRRDAYTFLTGKVPDIVLRNVRQHPPIRAWRLYRDLSPWDLGARVFPNRHPDYAAQRVLDDEQTWEQLSIADLRRYAAALDVPVDLLLSDFYADMYGIRINDELGEVE
jgi:hypothetical protein